MSKLSATLSKKVPIPGLEYSSQQFSCGLEIEFTGELTQDLIRQKIHNVYALLHATIDQEIQAAAANPPVFMSTLQNASRSGNAQTDTSRWRGRSYGDNGQSRWSKPGGGSRYNGQQHNGRATQAQVKAIFAIAKSNGMERNDILAMLEEQFNISQPDQLSIKQASKVIENLKNQTMQE